MPVIAFIILLVVGFLIGAIPFAFIFVKKMKGIDIRTVGSGNSGATNASRVLGKPMGIFILVLDLLKGSFAAYVLPWVYSMIGLPSPIWDELGIRGVGLCFGLAAFLGHCFSPFLRFKGGKGVATALGVYLVLAPQATLLTAVICILIILITRIVSIASITGAILLPIMLIIFDFLLESRQPNYFLFGATILLGALVVYRHRGNIQRLLKGQENKSA
ncbi:MAG: glycerol-3-phosphate 1-O-acyltransferase PlsY [Candidatus Sumerlaeia bacterium]